MLAMVVLASAVLLIKRYAKDDKAANPGSFNVEGCNNCRQNKQTSAGDMQGRVKAWAKSAVTGLQLNLEFLITQRRTFSFQAPASR